MCVCVFLACLFHCQQPCLLNHIMCCVPPLNVRESNIKRHKDTKSATHTHRNMPPLPHTHTHAGTRDMNELIKKWHRKQQQQSPCELSGLRDAAILMIIHVVDYRDDSVCTSYVRGSVSPGYFTERYTLKYTILCKILLQYV